MIQEVDWFLVTGDTVREKRVETKMHFDQKGAINRVAFGAVINR